MKDKIAQKIIAKYANKFMSKKRECIALEEKIELLEKQKLAVELDWCKLNAENIKLKNKPCYKPFYKTSIIVDGGTYMLDEFDKVKGMKC